MAHKPGAGSDPKVVQSKARNASSAALACPCGRAEVYALCCGRFHAGAPAPDAESLMRSRYTAYVLGLEDYLRATWHASTRPAALNLDAQPAAKWLGLDVKSRQAADAEDTAASVEFVARYRIGGRAVRLHEVSRFVCEAGRWYYVDGVVD